jgi:site-specific DNA-methyltransferase (adenine-specific)
MNQIVINGDNIELLKKYPDNYFDAVVTDPPYGLGKEPNAEELMKDWIEKGYHEISGKGFMGKEWDAFIPQPVFWKEVFRVLKHGGHVLSFFGTRTYDWGVMSMRFAGFEVRDCIQWLYGSGFPKSHNISKALDKQGGESLDWFIEYILEVAKERGISKKELTMLFPSKNGNPTGWLWNKQNNQSITLEQYNIIKEYLKLPFENIEEAKGGVIGKGKAGLTKGDIANFSGETEFDITAPATEAAKKWDGWGTALKPANEPIVLARKPLEKGLSIAENILKWGVGGINIDATRIGFKDDADYKESTQKNQHADFGTKPLTNNTVYGDYSMVQPTNYAPEGRFPANIILTHHDDCECKGTKKVKPSNGSGKASEKGGGFSKGMFGDGTSDNIGGGFTDADGNETVENWDCHEDCPIRILDEQSGVKASTRNMSYSRGGGDFIDGIPNQKEKSWFKSEVGGASRFFYVAKASKAERNKGLDEFDTKQTTGGGGTYNEEAGAKYGSIKAEGKNFHPTVKPIKLMQYLVKMITPHNGIVLDPFCGSGTTGVACKLDGFQFVGLEQDPDYAKIADARIKNTKVEIEKQTKLWS